jgi:hypothetical protein
MPKIADSMPLGKIAGWSRSTAQPARFSEKLSLAGLSAYFFCLLAAFSSAGCTVAGRCADIHCHA